MSDFVLSMTAALCIFGMLAFAVWYTADMDSPPRGCNTHEWIVRKTEKCLEHPNCVLSVDDLDAYRYAESFAEACGFES